MATLWLSYAWADNTNHDVDFVAQELTDAGLTVKLDRWTIGAGRRLWEQIESFIINPEQCDAWALFATQSSLGSEPCKEEYYYALHRALAERGARFPLIGIFASHVDNQLIPTGLETRLYVSTSDLDWKERVVAAAENRIPNINRPRIAPYLIQVHELPKKRFAIEVRPRAGVWQPFLAGIPLAEKDFVKPFVIDLPPGKVPEGEIGFVHSLPFEGETDDGKYWVFGADNPANPARSYYIFCSVMPTEVIFGVRGASPQYRHVF